MRLLQPAADWKPQTGAALTRLKSRTTQTSHPRRWVLGATAASAVFATLAVLPSRGNCAQRPCSQTVRVDRANYKQSGSPSAKIVLEVYTDFECPACAAFMKDVFPRIEEKYVRTGKARLIHRDFPLPQHPYAKSAARYANAAGEAGFYETAVKQLFATQQVWETDGDVDAQLARVLPLGAMKRVRELVQNGGALDQTVNSDVAMGIRDHLEQTPSVVVVHDGKRENLGGVPSFALLSRYLDGLTAN